VKRQYKLADLDFRQDTYSDLRELTALLNLLADETAENPARPEPIRGPCVITYYRDHDGAIGCDIMYDVNTYDGPPWPWALKRAAPGVARYTPDNVEFQSEAMLVAQFALREGETAVNASEPDYLIHGPARVTYYRYDDGRSFACDVSYGEGNDLALTGQSYRSAN
jgi:hypothetical protein